MTDSPVLTEHERRIAEMVAARHRLPADAEQVAQAVAELFGVDLDRLRGDSRKAYVTDARTVVVYLLAQRNLTHAQIGLVLNRDGSTINHYMQRMNADFELRKLAREMAA